MTPRAAAVLALCLAACAAPRARPPALAPAAGTLHAVVFLLSDCPIANAYAPTLEALRVEFEPRGVRFFLAYVDPALDAAGAQAHASAHGLGGTVVLDPAHELAGAVGAKVTPEVAVLGPGGALRYRGRIDDWFGDLGKKRPRPTRHDLRDALAAVLAGAAVRSPWPEAVGCVIE